MALSKGVRWLFVLMLAVPICATAADLGAAEQLLKMSDAQFQALVQRASHNDINAQTLLGLAYMSGVRVERNGTQAANWLTRAARHGQPVAQNNLGILCFEQHDYAAAFKWFKVSSSAGHVPAQYNLGSMYFKGWGVTQDYSQAAKYLEIAARQGEQRAQNLIGSLYERGLGVTQDAVAAENWYSQSAKQGDVQGMSNLGRMLSGRERTAEDHQRALSVLKLAADKGFAPAKTSLALLYVHGHCMKRDVLSAYALLESGANAGNVEATNFLKQLKASATPTELNAMAHVQPQPEIH